MSSHKKYSRVQNVDDFSSSDSEHDYTKPVRPVSAFTAMADTGHDDDDSDDGSTGEPDLEFAPAEDRFAPRPLRARLQRLRPQRIRESNCMRKTRQAMRDSALLSLLFALVVVIAGIVFFVTSDGPSDDARRIHVFSRYLLAMGVYGFVGGLTSWLAIIFMFQKVRCLPATGMISRHYQEIKARLKAIIMTTFLSTSFLHQQASDSNAFDRDTQAAMRIRALLTTERVDSIIEAKLTDLLSTDLLLQQQLRDCQMDETSLKAFIRGPTQALAGHVAPTLFDTFDPKSTFVRERLHAEVDMFLDKQLPSQSPERVTKLIRAIFGNPLRLLVVWGVMFGVVIGAICEAALN